MNKAFVCGNLGADPELRNTGNGTAVCNFSVATSKKFTKDGETKEHTEWHKIVVWGKQAENCAKYLGKGRQVLVEGEIRTRSWDDADGNKKYMTEIVAENVKFLGGGTGAGAAAGEDTIPF